MIFDYIIAELGRLRCGAASRGLQAISDDLQVHACKVDRRRAACLAADIFPFSRRLTHSGPAYYI